jgi:hypothetical protein
MKTQIRKHKTKKLFYNQFPYKIGTIINGASMIRYYGTSIVKNCTHSSSIAERMTFQEFQFLKTFASILDDLKVHQIKTRYEGSNVNFFLKDKSLYDLFLQKFENYIFQTWEPVNDDEAQFMLDNSKIVIVDQYPHKIYTHKVIFRQLPIEKKEILMNWFKKYGSNVFKISSTTEEYLSGKRYWAQDPFVLVGDTKMLIMLGLQCNEYIKRIEKFVLRSSINTL